MTATPTELTDKNLYAYCDNNPIMRVDGDGDFWNVLIGAGVGLISGVIDFIQSGENLTGNSIAKIAISTLAGAASAAAGPIAGALISGVSNGINSGLSGNSMDEIVVDSFVGTGVALVGSGAQYAVGRASASKFLETASKNQLKLFANQLGYTGRYFKEASSWTGPIMHDATMAFFDKPLAQMSGYLTSFWGEQLWNR